MKRNFNVVLKTFDGEEMKGNGGKTATGVSAVVDGLLADDRQLSGTDKLKRFSLAEKIYKAGDSEVELNTEELNLIKEAVGTVFSAIVVGQIFRIIEEG